jgi:hypothetical protein
MAPMPVPPGSGGNDRVSGLQQGLRLSDAEGIAAKRLDGAAEGSLQEALAIAPADDSRDVQPHPAVGERFTAGPLIRLIDARFADAGRTQAREPDAFSPMPMPPLLDIGIALAAATHSASSPTTDASEVTAVDVPGFRPSEDWRGFASDAPHAAPAATSAEAAAMQRIQPLSSALDAAVRLAADANVAAEALENLKRLLEHKQQLESLPQFAGSSPPASDVAQEPAHTPVEPSPLPLPLHSDPHAGSRSVQAALSQRRKRAPPERRGLDVPGFMAGFALSWAFGVVLYFFMTAG